MSHGCRLYKVFSFSFLHMRSSIHSHLHPIGRHLACRGQSVRSNQSRSIDVFTRPGRLQVFSGSARRHPSAAGKAYAFPRVVLMILHRHTQHLCVLLGKHRPLSVSFFLARNRLVMAVLFRTDFR